MEYVLCIRMEIRDDLQSQAMQDEVFAKNASNSGSESSAMQCHGQATIASSRGARALTVLAYSYDSSGSDVNDDVNGRGERSDPSPLFSDDDEESNDEEVDDDEPDDGIVISTPADGRRKSRPPPRVHGELTIADLPPVTAPEHVLPASARLDRIGIVHKIVQPHFLIIQATPPHQSGALDEGTVVWSANRTPVGLVFETFGPVQSPFYSIRFNSVDEISARGVAAGDVVYVAPDCANFTRYVFAHALKTRGSDASWKDDVEPPDDALDYSDDEKEKKEEEEEQIVSWKYQNPVSRAPPPPPLPPPLMRPFSRPLLPSLTMRPSYPSSASARPQLGSVFYRPPPIAHIPIRLPYAGVPLYQTPK